MKAKNWLDALNGSLTVSGFAFELVRKYKLLGGVTDHISSLGPEFNTRQLAITKVSFPYHRYISTKANLTGCQSINTINSMLVSSLLSNSHTWCNMSESQLAHINSRLATAYGACIPYKVMYSSICEKFRRLRLAYFPLPLCLMPTGSSGIASFFFCEGS